MERQQPHPAAALQEWNDDHTAVTDNQVIAQYQYTKLPDSYIKVRGRGVFFCCLAKRLAACHAFGPALKGRPDLPAARPV